MDIMSILGNRCVTETKKDNITKLAYKIPDPSRPECAAVNNSDFLDYYNEPEYFSEYTFADGKLIRIYFGFHES